MNYISAWLDSTTMYRVVLYVLLSYVVVAFTLSFTDYLYYSPISILLSLGVLAAMGLATHYICKTVSRAPANLESTIITILILFLIFDPVADVDGLGRLAVVSVVAVLGKYILAWRKLHIINPVALSAVLVGSLGFVSATWWVGNYAMFALVLSGGLLITAKIKRWELVYSSVGAALLVTVVMAWLQGSLRAETVEWFFIAWPIIFFATVMVTEPLSTPAGRFNQILYGSVVGGISSVFFAFEAGPLYLSSSPEFALLVGNMLFYPKTLRARLVLTLKEVKEIARDTYEYVLSPSIPIKFRPGQYLEWTLPHQDVDRRGIRRYFTIASSPTESDIVLGLKIPQQHSSFKQELVAMKPGDIMYATSLDGDFVLPENKDGRPLVCIAGGIGITPFRSMVTYMLDTQEKREVTLFFCNKTQEDIVWQELWSRAQEQLGMQTVHVLDRPDSAWPGERGRIDQAMLERYVADLHVPVYYISGPPGMVHAYTNLLKACGVLRRNIVTDFFPGLA